MRNDIMYLRAGCFRSESHYIYKYEVLRQKLEIDSQRSQHLIRSFFIQNGGLSKNISSCNFPT